jgi:Kunitz/Bovine pancreatic trypsin inhibitor domain
MIARVLKYLVGLGFCLALGGSCGGTVTPTEGSESHFLDACMPGSCGDELSCICGVCTQTCSGSDCSALSPGAECVELGDLPNTDGCTDVSAAQPVCDQACVANAECSSLGASFACRDGVCRSTTPPNPPRDGGSTVPPELCQLPANPGDGTCLQFLTRFWHNPATGACEAFNFGGCGGNANNFKTRDDCEATCGVYPIEMFACEVSSDCAVMSPGCCGACEPIYLHDLVAVSTTQVTAYRAAKCPPPEPTCGACPDAAPQDKLGANYGARCVAGRCQLFDVRESEYSDCSDGAACKLTSGFGCCSRCDDAVAAIREDVDPYTALACDDAAEIVGCDQCLPSPPPDASAVCVGTRCQVLRDQPPSVAACHVGDTVYPSGSTGIPDPFSCNTCQCIDGGLDCTAIGGCEISCPTGTVQGTSCDTCGPADDCLVVFHGCLGVCDGWADCGGMTPFCTDGVCNNTCG